VLALVAARGAFYNQPQANPNSITHLEVTTVNGLRRVILGLTCLAALILTALAQADGKLDIGNWKDILPEGIYAKLVDDAAKKLANYCSSASQFNQNGKKVQAEAMNLVVYAEIARHNGDSQATGLRQAALDLIKAAKEKNGDEAKRLATAIAAYKKLSAPSGEDLDLAKATDMKVIMKVGLKEIDTKNLPLYKRMTPTAFNSRQDEVIKDMYKIAALSVATTAQVPTGDFPKGKSAKDWLGPAEEMRKYALEAGAAAKAKKLPELKTAVNNLIGSCAKCHDDFRKEEN
jgi:hypothetical protein